MGFEDIATKEDLKEVEATLLKNLQHLSQKTKVPQVVHTSQAIEMFGGDVTDKFLRALRNAGKLNPKKVGGLWLWNVKEIVALLPQDPE
jgi:hypothetical protein